MKSTLKTIPTSSLRSAAAASTLVALLLTGCGGTAVEEPGAGGPAFSDCVTQSASYVQTGIDAADFAAGGQLYDNWPKMLNVTPVGDHPLWSSKLPAATNTTTGAGTWRCKECHGWDYKGASGNYGPGSSKYTGFAGILTAAQRDGATAPINLFCAVKSGIASTLGKHSFAAQLQDQDILNLTKFMAHGGVKDLSTLVSSNGGTSGDPAVGETTYKINCSSGACHGSDGALNGGDAGLGEIASKNPWEMVHKIRFGVGENLRTVMTAFDGVLLDTDIANIIAYGQKTLAGSDGVVIPGTGTGGGGGGGGVAATGVLLGGLLYDNHWEITGKTTTTDNPMWVLRKPDPVNGATNARTGIETWRCKECHGWDYKGAEGAYGPGRTANHYTGFPSLWARKDTFTAERRASLTSYLTNGVKKQINGVFVDVHNFGTGAPGLTAAQISALVDFLMGTAGNPASAGLIDTAEYILEGALAGGAKGDFTRGATLYASGSATALNCANASCHGTDGKKLDFAADGDPNVLPNEFLGDLAKENPWEVLHKARFGTPDAPTMTPVLTWGTTKDASDITSYTQKSLQ